MGVLLLWVVIQGGLASTAEPVPPGTPGTAWQGSVPRYEEVFFSEAEESTFKGARVEDESASAGEAVFFAVSKASRPDTEVSWVTPILGAGFHRVRVRLRARGRSDDGLLGHIEVCSADTGEPVAPPRPVHDFHHESCPGYFEVVVGFRVTHPGRVSVRMAHNGETDLWVDAMRVESESSTTGPAAARQSFPAQPRARVSLNGSWQFQPVYGDPFFPPPDRWSPVSIRVPSAWNANAFARAFQEQEDYYPTYPKEWDAAKAGWYRLRFSLGGNEGRIDRSGGIWHLGLPVAGQRVVVHFDAVAYSAEVYLNGVAVGYHEGGFTPFEVDVTDALRPGAENELLVGVRSWLHYHDRKKRKPLTTGSFWGGTAAGIWQPVFLESRPSVFVSDIFVQTSVRRKELLVSVEVRNEDSRDRTVLVGAALVASPTDRRPVEEGVPEFPSRQGRVPRGGKAVFEWATAWERPRLWSPEDPYLYNLAASVAANAGEAEPSATDSVVQKFGFREIWIDGDRILLNGRRLKLRGDAWHFMGPPQMDPRYADEWYRLCRSSNLNLVRLHAQPFPEFYLDLADTTGMLIVDETSWWASSGGHIYGEVFVKRFERELEELIRRDRNHPSVIMWSLGNEVTAGHRFYSDDGMRDVSSLHSLCEELAERIRQLDPTRPISSDGDEDLSGAADVWSLHYPYPDVEHPSDMPVTIGEACPMYYAGPLEAESAGGEEVFRSFRARNETVTEIAYWQIRNYRRWAQQVTPFNLVWYCLEPLPFGGGLLQPEILSAAPGLPDRVRPYCSTLNPGWEQGIPAYRPNRIYDLVRDALIPRRFFLARRGLRFYAPGRPEIPVLVFNDTPSEEEFTIRWKLSAAGNSGAREVSVVVPGGEFRKVEANIPLPAVHEREQARLEIQLRAGDGVVCSSTHPVFLYPHMDRWPTSPELSEKLIVVYTGSGDLLEALEYLRIGFERIYDLAELDQVSCDLLIVGRSTVYEKKSLRALQDRLRSGLRVLFMEGNAAWLEALELAKVEAAPYEKVFPCRWDHPLVEGMDQPTLEYWMAGVEDRAREDRIERLGEEALAPFQQGNFRGLLSISGGRSVVAEGVDGSGEFFINQVNVLRRLPDEPAALQFLGNLIRYAATAPEWELVPAAAVASATSRLSQFLGAVGLAAANLESPVDPFLVASKGVVLVDASAPDSDGWWSQIRGFVRGGGTAVLWGMTPNTVVDWTAGVPGRPRVEPCDSEQLVKVSSEDGSTDPLLDGMRHATMYWVRGSLPSPILEFSIRISGGPEVSPLLEVPSFDWRSWEENPETTRTVLATLEERKPRGEAEYGLVAVRMGEGRLFLSQLPVNLNEPRAVELGRQFLTNVNVRLERQATRRQVASNVDAEGFFRSWLLCGPFTAEVTGSLLDVDFLGGEDRVQPDAGGAQSDAGQWKLYYSPEAALDFEVPGVYGPTDRAVAYAAVYVYSPRSYEDLPALPATEGIDLLFGSDDGCTVWLNGEQIYSKSTSRPLVVDNIRLEGLEFRRGWNLLLFKVEDQVWKWGLIARLADQSGHFPPAFLVSPQKLALR